MKKIFFILPFLISSVCAYDPIQETILESDLTQIEETSTERRLDDSYVDLEIILNSNYDDFAHSYDPKKISTAQQHAYWAIADDVTRMRSTNFAFDWFKAFASKKLILSGIFLASNNSFFHYLQHCDLIDMNYKKAFIMKSTAIAIFLWSLWKGSTYYYRLQNKIKDAERIKFLLMS